MSGKAMRKRLRKQRRGRWGALSFEGFVKVVGKSLV